MGTAFLDASALVKRYSSEQGSLEVDEIFRTLPPENILCSLLGAVEVIAVLVRKRNDGRIGNRFFEQAILRFESEFVQQHEHSLIPIPSLLALEAIDLVFQHNLNASDALILCSALHENRDDDEPLLFVTSDQRLARAAAMEQLQVFNPESQSVPELRALLKLA